MLADLDAFAESLLQVDGLDAKGKPTRLPLPGPTPVTREQFAALLYLASRHQAVQDTGQKTRCGVYRVRLVHLQVELKDNKPSSRLGVALGGAEMMGAPRDLLDEVFEVSKVLWPDPMTVLPKVRRLLGDKWTVYQRVRSKAEERGRIWGGFIRKHLRQGLVPYPHQATGGQFIRDARFAALVADEQGAGKTMTTLLATLDAHALGQTVFPALVVCPSTVHQTWIEEAETWLATTGLRTAGLSAKLDLTGYELGPLTTRLGSLDRRIRKGQLKRHEVIRRHVAALVDSLPPAQRELLVADPKRPSGWRIDPLAQEGYLRRPLLVVATPGMVLRSRAALEKLRWGTVVLDEFDQYFINHESATCQLITRLGSKAAVRLALSGTPLPNGRPINLYAVLRFLNKLPRGKTKYKAYGRAFCRGNGGRGYKVVGKKRVKNKQTGQYENKPLTRPDFSGRSDPLEFATHMRRVQLRRTKREVFTGDNELPPKSRFGLKLSLGWEERLELAQVEDATRDAIAKRADELRLKLGVEREVTRELLEEQFPTAPSDFIDARLRQASLGEAWIDKRVQRVLAAEAAILLQKLRVTVGKVKVRAMLPWIMEQVEAGERPLLFCDHIEVAELLEDELRQRLGDPAVFMGTGGTPRGQRKPMQNRWNAGEGKVWVCTRAFSAGMTVTSGRMVAFVERFWDPKNELQAEDRVHRPGQTRPCFIVYSHARGTTDDHMLDLTSWKEVGMEGLQGNPNVRSIEWILRRGDIAA